MITVTFMAEGESLETNLLWTGSAFEVEIGHARRDAYECAPPHRVRLSNRLQGVGQDAARYRSGIMAGPAVSGLAGDLHDASSVDADRRQDPAVADTLAQSFMAGHALRDRTRPDHFTHAVWRKDVPNRLRFH